MKQEIITLFILFLVFFGITTIDAQEAIPSSGGNATGSGGSISYSIGQVFYNSF